MPNVKVSISREVNSSKKSTIENIQSLNDNTNDIELSCDNKFPNNIFEDSSRNILPKELILEKNVELNEVENNQQQINIRPYVKLYQFTHALDKCVIDYQTQDMEKQPMKVDRALRKAGFSITILMMN